MTDDIICPRCEDYRFDATRNEDLQKLVDEWRDMYQDYLDHERQSGPGYKNCADELEAVLDE